MIILIIIIIIIGIIITSLKNFSLVSGISGR
jgi:hypothetical protein